MTTFRNLSLSLSLSLTLSVHFTHLAFARGALRVGQLPRVPVLVDEPGLGAARVGGPAAAAVAAEPVLVADGAAGAGGELGTAARDGGAVHGPAVHLAVLGGEKVDESL